MVWPVTFDRIPHTHIQAIDTTAKIPEKGSCKTGMKERGVIYVNTCDKFMHGSFISPHMINSILEVLSK